MITSYDTQCYPYPHWQGATGIGGNGPVPYAAQLWSSNSVSPENILKLENGIVSFCILLLDMCYVMLSVSYLFIQ